ncbi:MAG: cytochrome c [Silvanigrellales bacterium]|nr:cytochrome c [Silvanigrellales bacterium]
MELPAEPTHPTEPIQPCSNQPRQVEVNKRRLLSVARMALSGSALVAGGLLAACGSESADPEVITKERIVEVPAVKPKITKKTEKLEGVTLKSFTQECKTAAGIVEIHASCAGVNSCKGFSFSYGTRIDHTCRAMNTCAGMSCVVLPADAGLQGAEILQGKKGEEKVGSEVQCAFCHGDGKDAFVLPVPPGSNVKAKETEFAKKSDEALMSAIAFGLKGRKATGVAYANMPGYHGFYSRAEVERVVAHIRTLPVKVKPWTDPK